MSGRPEVPGGDVLLCARIEAVFADCFEARHGVRLVARDDEPLYEPGGAAGARLGYLRNHPRSALHEAAHWCIAGFRRRQQIDFGYWYRAPPRSRSQQRDFETVEVWPQALEQLFCRAVGIGFEVSVDDLESTSARGRWHFSEAVRQRGLRALREERPRRAMVFRHALLGVFTSTCGS